MFKSAVLATMTMTASASWNGGYVAPARDVSVSVEQDVGYGRKASYSVSGKAHGHVGLGHGRVGHGAGYGGVGYGKRSYSVSVSDKKGLGYGRGYGAGYGAGYGGVGYGKRSYSVS